MPNLLFCTKSRFAGKSVCLCPSLITVGSAAVKGKNVKIRGEDPGRVPAATQTGEQAGKAKQGRVRQREPAERSEGAFLPWARQTEEQAKEAK